MKIRTAIAVLLLLSAAALAQSAVVAGPEAGGSGGNIGLGAPSPDMVAGYIKHMDQLVTLTEEQKNEMTQILEQRTKDLKEFNEKVAPKAKAAHEAMINAYKADDQEAIARAEQEYQALYAPLNELIKKSLERMDKVLTPQQKQKLRDSQLAQIVKACTYPATLTEQQMNALKRVVEMGDDQTQMYTAVTEALNDILKPEQKSAMMKHRAMGAIRMRYYSLRLTPEQEKQFDEACSAIVKDTTLEFNEVVEKLQEKSKSILTEEQRAKAEKASGAAVRQQGGE